MTDVVHGAHHLRLRIRSTWWMLLGQGVLALLAGSLLITNTDASLRAFAVFLGVYWPLGGVFDILEGLTHRDHRGIWHWSLVGGLLSIAAGALWLSGVVLGADTLPLIVSTLIAVLAIAAGAANMIWAWRVRDKLEADSWIMLWGALSIVLGIWIIVEPFISSTVWITLAALIALSSGTGMLVWVGALVLRKHAEDGKPEPHGPLPVWLFAGVAVSLAVVATGMSVFGSLHLAGMTPVDIRLAESEKRGEEAFGMYCSACHNASTQQKYGPGLAGVFQPGGPSLPRGLDYGGRLPNGREINTLNVAEWLRTGGRGKIGAMPPVGANMTDTEVTDVIAFLQKLKK